MTQPVTRREQCRAAQRRYAQTLQGKAARHRYQRTTKGKATLKRHRDKRVRTAGRVIGIAATRAHALIIRAYIKQRREGYVAQQRQSAGTKAQSVSPGAVSTKAAV